METFAEGIASPVRPSLTFPWSSPSCRAESGRDDVKKIKSRKIPPGTDDDFDMMESPNAVERVEWIKRSKIANAGQRFNARCLI
jgi:hypothetical protein